MKKQLLVVVFALICSIGSVFAQERQMPTPEERTKEVIEKMAPLSLKTDQAEKVKTIITTFYTDAQKARQEANGDREAMRSKYEALSKTRDEGLKTVLTDEQYTKWVNEIEPTTRPQRRQKQ